MNIDDLDKDVLHNLLLFIYTGKVEEGLEEKAFGMLTAAEYYDLKVLKHKCEELLCEKLDIDNALEMLVFADLNNASILRSQAVRFITANRRKVVVPVWLKLKMYPEIIYDLFEASAK